MTQQANDVPMDARTRAMLMVDASVNPGPPGVTASVEGAVKENRAVEVQNLFYVSNRSHASVNVGSLASDASLDARGKPSGSGVGRGIPTTLDVGPDAGT